jgi:hypothetical protein
MTYTKYQQKRIEMIEHYKKYALMEYEKLYKDLKNPTMYEIQNRLQDKYEINDDIMEMINKYYMKKKNEVNIKFFHNNEFKWNHGKGLMLWIPETGYFKDSKPVLKKLNLVSQALPYSSMYDGKQLCCNSFYTKNQCIYSEKEQRLQGVPHIVYKSDMLNINGYYFGYTLKGFYNNMNVSYKTHMKDYKKQELQDFLDKHNIEYKKSDTKHGLVCRLIGENPKDKKYTDDMRNMFKR